MKKLLTSLFLALSLYVQAQVFPNPVCDSLTIVGPDPAVANSNGNVYTASYSGLCTNVQHSWCLAAGAATINSSLSNPAVVVSAGLANYQFVLCDTLRCDEGIIICCKLVNIIPDTGNFNANAFVSHQRGRGQARFGAFDSSNSWALLGSSNAAGTLTMYFDVHGAPTPLSIKVVGLLGNHVGQFEFIAVRGVNTFEVSTASLSNGLYFIYVTDGVNYVVQRIVVKSND